MSREPTPTHSGALPAISVAVAAVVSIRAEFRKAKLTAKRAPPTAAQTTRARRGPVPPADEPQRHNDKRGKEQPVEGRRWTWNARPPDEDRGAGGGKDATGEGSDTHPRGVNSDEESAVADAGAIPRLLV